MLRTIGLILFGLLAVTGCAILALVLSVPSASAAENPDESPPVQSVSVRSLSVQSLLAPPVSQLESRLSTELSAATAPLQHSGETILPKTTQVVARSVTHLGSTTVATVTTVVDALPPLDIVIDSLLPAEVASPFLLRASEVVSENRAQARSTGPVDTADDRFTTQTITVPEPQQPGQDSPAAPPATAPGPVGAHADPGLGAVMTSEGWSVTLASGRTTTQCDTVPGSPSFGFDSTPD